MFGLDGIVGRGSGGPRDAVEVVGNLSESSGDGLAVPDEKFDTAECGKLSETAIRRTDEEDPAASGVDVAGMGKQGQFSGVRAGRDEQGRDAQLGQQRSQRITIEPVRQAVGGNSVVDLASGGEQCLQPSP